MGVGCDIAFSFLCWNLDYSTLDLARVNTLLHGIKDFVF